jgi:dimeric dUTPase (all-alpha-NTP-PPase superfamily)
MKLSATQLMVMLELQHAMNSKVNPDWVAANNNWYRAIQVEGVEAIEHHGWKWWKKQDCDWPQLRMELVDIWHFVLSAAIQRCQGDQARAAAEMLEALERGNAGVTFDGREYSLAPLDLLSRLDLLVGLAAAQRTNLALFGALLADCGMRWSDLFRQYLGKNVLNMFRQDHGYKAGTYIKLWHGREDNEHLVEVLEIIDVEAPDVQGSLYEALRSRYQQVTLD